MGMKVEIKAQKYNRFAGISFVMEELKQSGLLKLIDKELGTRSKKAGYSYSDVFKNQVGVFFCGGDCMEDLQVNLKKELSKIPENKVPSPDTSGRCIKNLATPNISYTSSQGKTYDYNVNEKLNKLVIKALIKTKQLTKNTYYDFDYDNQLIPTEKYDTKYSYKKCFGYFPGVATIGEHIVYVENRDGNANVKFKQAQTLERAYSLLEKEGIKINRSRMDCGSYSKEIVEVVDKYSNLFYIRAGKSPDLYERITEIKKWKTVEINNKKYEVASLPYTGFAPEKGYRLVVMREETNEQQADLFTGDTFMYRSILTNDQQSTEKEIIEYYNARGASEKIFDVMNNDFGWSKLPFSFMNQNTAYMILMAMIKNFYTYYVAKISLIFNSIKPNSRLKRFIFSFISVVGKWKHSSRQNVLVLFTERLGYQNISCL